MPGYPATTCRMVHETGEFRFDGTYWWGPKTGPHLHVIRFQMPEATVDAWGIDVARQHRDEVFALRCDCGAAPEEGGDYSTGKHRLYDTEGGDLHPGDMFWEDCYHHDGKCHWWDNCPGQHLHVVLPNGHHWDIDSRARNCTLPNDRTHRCWVRTGEPPRVTVGKGGVTCSAGAGSIMSGDYHGFLRDGILTAG